MRTQDRTAEGSFNDIKMADQKGRLLLGARFAGKRFAVHEESDGTAILTPVVVYPESDAPLTRRSLQDRLAFLRELRDDWDGHGSLAPSTATIEHAGEALALLQAGALARSFPWTDPHVGCNERGQITLEWWRGNRTLTVFVRSDREIDYLRSWGANIESEMEDGPIANLTDFLALSRWLSEGDVRGAA